MAAAYYQHDATTTHTEAELLTGPPGTASIAHSRAERIKDL